MRDNKVEGRTQDLTLIFHDWAVLPICQTQPDAEARHGADARLEIKALDDFCQVVELLLVDSYLFSH